MRLGDTDPPPNRRDKTRTLPHRNIRWSSARWPGTAGMAAPPLCAKRSPHDPFHRPFLRKCSDLGERERGERGSTLLYYSSGAQKPGLSKEWDLSLPLTPCTPMQTLLVKELAIEARKGVATLRAKAFCNCRIRRRGPRFYSPIRWSTHLAITTMIFEDVARVR